MLVLGWLNIAAQPCLMAMETAPETLQASEPAAHSGHAAHIADATAATDCDHCPTGVDHQKVLCETGSAADCEIFAGYEIDGRQFKSQLKDLSSPPAMSTIENALDYSAPVRLFPPRDNKRLKFAGDPPLNIRHCVFLK
jgi:formiminotetrahydrofolate cyclodeaminase